MRHSDFERRRQECHDHLAKTSNPTDADIDEALRGNICRCGTYVGIRQAIHREAAIQRQGGVR
ncbi:MAG TPA: 2Fe-2S iron-sulfur cluster-binding protein [Bryobacteraceae bacterium]|nr:2Fe-2S iron-sulfur cluster-binding protein [Bryobacteraceae bacterium]